MKNFVLALSLAFANISIANELTVVTVNCPDHVAAVNSILARKGVSDSNLILIGDSEGATDYNTWMSAIEVAAQKTPIVFSPLGPVSDEACAALSKKANVAFVVVAGNGSLQLNTDDAPNCTAKNILFVASLDQTNNTLASFSNWGLYVRIAAPGRDISFTDTNGITRAMSGNTVSASLVAGNLVQYAKTRHTLKGAELVDAFLRDRTVVLPALFGKIQGSLALDDKDL